MFLGLILVVIDIYLANKEVDLIKINKSTFGSEVILDNDEKIRSDSVKYFIGKTNNFIFIYDEYENSTEIYPTSRIKKIKIINKKE